MSIARSRCLFITPIRNSVGSKAKPRAVPTAELTDDVTAIPVSGGDASPIDPADRAGPCCQQARAARVTIEMAQWFHVTDPFGMMDRV